MQNFSSLPLRALDFKLPNPIPTQTGFSNSFFAEFQEFAPTIPSFQVAQPDSNSNRFQQLLHGRISGIWRYKPNPLGCPTRIQLK